MSDLDGYVEIGARATDDPEKGPGFRITQLWACIAVDPVDSAEGLPATQMDMQGLRVLLPLIAADEARLISMRDKAIQLGRKTRQRIVLARFSVREDLEVLYEPKGK